MGLFKWANKGIKIDKKEVVAPPAEMDLTQALQVSPMVQEQPAPPPQPVMPEGPTLAQSVLFDKHIDTGASYLASAGQFSQTLAGPTLGNRNILVVAPRSEKDVSMIVENLGHGDPCIVNFEGMPVSEAQRRLDFLSGVVCAIGGTIKPIDANKYVITPNMMGIKM